MNDFYNILINSQPFVVNDFNRLHQESKIFIETELQKARSDKKIVITHHVPTLLNYPEEYKNSVLNQGFAVELFPLIESSNAMYWIYGHHHRNIPEFTIGTTKLLTNQLGYVIQKEHRGFNHSAVIEI